jgi:hypothetical protein
MTEDFLHYLWKFQDFDTRGLLTTEGEAISILKSGFHNSDAGPDFGDARIMIGTQIWAGNVELHLHTSDWNKHKHQNDPAYNNVILHVVYESDRDPILNEAGNPIPTVELKGRFDEYRYWHYEQLVQSKGFIPCAKDISDVSNLHRESMLERVLVERITNKASRLKELLKQNQNNWEETAYQWLSYGFGLKVNAEPMIWLSRALPLKLIQKHGGDLHTIEALVFGASGLLGNCETDDYVEELRRTFSFYQKKYSLEPLEPSVWKYSKLRPVSFPDQRLAQWASLLANQQHFFSTIIRSGRMEKLYTYFNQRSSAYFEEHYRLGKESKPHKAAPSQAFIERLIINVIVPFLQLYAQVQDETFYEQRALDLLDQLAPENNSLMEKFKQAGLEIDSAFTSQALLELESKYCSLKKCLTCNIGNAILKKQT